MIDTGITGQDGDLSETAIMVLGDGTVRFVPGIFLTGERADTTSTSHQPGVAAWPALQSYSSKNELQRHVTQVQISRSDVNLDFGHIPVHADAGAESLLAALPSPGVDELVGAVRLWAAGLPVRRVRVTSNTDPEATDWREVVIELEVDGETSHVLQLWDELSSMIDDVKRSLDASVRSELDRSLAVHLDWQPE